MSALILDCCGGEGHADACAMHDADSVGVVCRECASAAIEAAVAQERAKSLLVVCYGSEKPFEECNCTRGHFPALRLATGRVIGLHDMDEDLREHVAAIARGGK